MMITLAASEVLDREFLGVRARLIELAATLDRLERSEGSVTGDPRAEQVRKALRILADDGTQRAEKVQLVFSLPYREDWRNGPIVGPFSSSQPQFE